MPTPLLEASALELRFGYRTVLSGVGLTVGAGQIHGLLGPRGAGKSLLLRLLAGELAPTGGTVSAGRVVLVADAAAAPLALARALAGDPAVLLVDEPPEGFDAETRATVRALVMRHAARGGATVWAAPRLDTLHGLASTVTLLAAGRVRYSGTVEALVSRSLARSADAIIAAA